MMPCIRNWVRFVSHHVPSLVDGVHAAIVAMHFLLVYDLGISHGIFVFPASSASPGDFFLFSRGSRMDFDPALLAQ